MKLISNAYREQNEMLLSNDERWASKGKSYWKFVETIIKQVNPETILDYGCGRNSLNKIINHHIPNIQCFGYDPCVPEFSAKPNPAELVICTDVLEHIEPKLINNVLDHLKELALQYIYLSIALIPARDCLPDGRNAHILLKDKTWWIAEIENRFVILESNKDEKSKHLRIFAKTRKG